MVAVAAFAARAAGVVVAPIRATPRRTRSAAKVGSFSFSPSAQRYSIAKFWPPVNPTSPNLADAQERDFRMAARALGLQIHVLRATAEGDFDTVFASLLQLRAGGLVISSDSFFFSRGAQLAALAARHAVPTIYPFRENAAAGGLISYGGRDRKSTRLAGGYAGRILKGEKPADLPVQQSTKIELVINIKTAKTLGIDVPLHLQQIADEVIE